MSEKYLNYEGLSTYNRKIKKYIQNRTPDATEDKKGLLKISDLPAYTSSRTTRFSDDFEKGYYDDEFIDVFSFLAKSDDGTDYSTGVISDSAVFPTYTVVIDGKVFENVECSTYDSDSFNDFEIIKSATSEDIGFSLQYRSGTGYNHFSKFYVETEEGGEEDDGTPHHLEVYQENAEEIHKLDIKYLNIAQSIADGATGLATGDQVYDYVQSVLMETISSLQSRVQELENQMIVNSEASEGANDFSEVEPENSSDSVVTDYE